MLIRSLVYKRDCLIIASERATPAGTLKVLGDSDSRCVSILDDARTIFRGNIYKIYTYCHKSQGGDMNLPVTYLLENAVKTVKIDLPFFRVFSSIKNPPYIAVLDEENHFYGVLTHTRLLDMLSDAWSIRNGSYILTVLSDSDRDNLVKMARIISKYSNIAGCLILDVKTNELVHRNLFILPIGIPRETTTAVVNHLGKKDFVVSEIEDPQSRLTIRSAEQPGELKD